MQRTASKAVCASCFAAADRTHEVAPLRYVSGETVLLGDQVRIEGGSTPGLVQEVIETEQHMKAWNVTEPGLMIKSAPFGLVFWPETSDDPVVFIARAQGGAL